MESLIEDIPLHSMKRPLQKATNIQTTVNGVPIPNGYIYSTSLAPKAQ